MRPVTRTKHDLLRQLSRGLMFVHAAAMVTRFRVAVSGDPDPDNGIWIYLETYDGYGYKLDTAAPAYARVNGRRVSLSPAEAARVARYIGKAIRRRDAPWDRHTLGGDVT